MSDQTSGRIWIVTGAGRGIGASITAAALEGGDVVVATDRNPGRIVERYQGNARLVAKTLDIVDEQQAKSVMKEVAEQFGRIDVLVNNAGVGLLGAIEESTLEEIRRTFEVNVFGTLNVLRAALPYLRGQRSGHIINISSGGGYQAFAGYGIYCASKFAVEGITEALHAELLPLGIRVTAVQPGYTRTDFIQPTRLMASALQIPDYEATVGETRKSAAAYNGNQPNDPDKLARAIVSIVNAKNPPLRLPLGNDVFEMIKEKNAFVERELEEWRTLSQSVAFEKPL
jgi:NAD(P)-dependent dehydrogenase (short-subunit alcohol dehydrogenase family)